MLLRLKRSKATGTCRHQFIKMAVWNIIKIAVGNRVFLEKPRVAIRLKFGGKEVGKKEKRDTKRVISKYLHKEIQVRLKRKKKKWSTTVYKWLHNSVNQENGEITGLPQKTCYHSQSWNNPSVVSSRLILHRA